MKQISKLLKELFVNSDIVYAKAYLDKTTGRMGYKKVVGLVNENLINEHLEGNITIGVYELKEKKVKWACLDFDKDTEEDFNNAKILFNKLKEDGLNPLAELSGGGKYKTHIWILCDCEAEDIKNYLEDVCEREKVKPHEIFPKQTEVKKGDYGNLVKLPLAYHLKTKRRSCFLNDNFEILDLDETEQKLKFHLENIDEIPKVIIKEKKITEYQTENIKPSEFDEFFNKIKYTHLPHGISKEKTIGKTEAGVNNNIIKNLAIWFYKKGYTLEQLEKEVKPIYDKEKWNFGNLKGWFKKAEKGDITEISTGELKEWCGTYKKDMLKFLPQEKKHNDLKTFIFNKEDIIQTRVFSSHLLDKNTFAFGVLLPRDEDILNRKNEVTGTHQIWRSVILTSKKRGLVVSKWFQKEYKIKYEEIPYEMKLRWELEDINTYLHKEPPIISGKELFEDIKNQYNFYSYFQEKNWYSVNTLWDIGTYFHQLFSAYPLKEERGFSGTAKTKCMVISSYMTLNATDIMVNPSEATLFRETENLRPTKYIDEAEKLFKWTKDGIEADNRVELVNASYTRNGSVPRQEKYGNKYITKWYHVYSPTRISSINGLYGATESRAITQIHTRASDKDVRGEREPEDDIENGKWKNIRNKCYLFALQNWEKVYTNYLNFDIGKNENGEEYEIKKRDLQLWKPLLVIAEIIDKEKLYPEIIKFAEKISKLRKIDILSEATTDYKLLDCLNYLIKTSSEEKIYINDIRNRFNNIYRINEPTNVGYNKTISSHLDKMGFKDYRNFNTNKGSYFEINEKIFNSIVETICPQLSIKNVGVGNV